MQVTRTLSCGKLIWIQTQKIFSRFHLHTHLYYCCNYYRILSLSFPFFSFNSSDPRSVKDIDRYVEELKSLKKNVRKMNDNCRSKVSIYITQSVVLTCICVCKFFSSDSSLSYRIHQNAYAYLFNTHVFAINTTCIWTQKLFMNFTCVHVLVIYRMFQF